MEDRIFMDIDTQFDFMDPNGALYVPGAETLIPNLVRLMTYARENEILVLSSADAHTPDDAEFKVWPAHCVVGTKGQQRIKETLLPGAMTVSWQSASFVLPEKWPAQMILDKDAYDTAANPRFDAILDALGRRRFVVFGVATEFCVLADVLSLRKRNKEVDVVVDAIKPITDEGGRNALIQMVAAGAHTVTTDEAMADVSRVSSSPQ